MTFKAHELPRAMFKNQQQENTTNKVLIFNIK